MNKLIKCGLNAAIIYLGALSAAFAQTAPTPPELDLQLHAGLSIKGVIGTIYSVEYVTDLVQTNSWRCLTLLQPPSTNYLWFDPTPLATGQRFYRAIDFAAPTNLVFIPPGTFRMGSPTNDDSGEPFLPNQYPQTAVTISRGFWMGKYEVTQGEYLAVMGSNPSTFKGDTNLPVEMVSWFNATNYCGKLTRREQAAGRIPTGSQFRLPTEAEWEYACRAGTSTLFSYGDDLDFINLPDYAWYGVDDGSGMTHPVGQKSPNPWGLYDMHGNVEEWCQDWSRHYPGGIALDPPGPATGSLRVFRGGDWNHDGAACRSAFRISHTPDTTYPLLGFRVVLSADQP